MYTVDDNDYPTLDEFKIRPVTRFNLTHYSRRGKDGGSSRTLGEYPTTEVAREIGLGMAEAIPGAILIDERGEQVGGQHTHYPARYAIGSRAIRQPSAERLPSGALEDYATEPVLITGVMFADRKVTYRVTHEGDRKGFVAMLDSTELNDFIAPQALAA